MGGRLGVTLVCVGRLREPSLASLAGDYATRLQRYAKLDVVEVPHERVTARARGALEGLERAFGAGRERWALDVRGDELDSPGLARLLGRVEGVGGPLTFAIGGPDGLPEPLLARATKRLSFSRLTFPHELFRVLFLEQLYRAYTILRGEPYHK